MQQPRTVLLTWKVCNNYMLKQERKTGKRVAEKAGRRAEEKKLGVGGRGRNAKVPLQEWVVGDSQICHIGKQGKPGC